ncbi:MAG: phosphoglucosamine mutase [Thermoplasmata archaeon]
MHYFGSSGIRGIVNAELTTELASAAGRAIGSGYGRVIIGTDTRTTSRMIAKSVIAGMLASGSNVVDIGVVPTPVVGFLARDFDCGVVITASHNPPEYNGIKLINADGSGFSIRQMEEIEERIDRMEFRNPGYSMVGRYLQCEWLKEKYIEKILSEFGKIGKRVAVDAGNGTAGLFTPLILRKLGCDVLSLNAQPDGTFPWRESEPSKENLIALANAVVSEKCDVGIAHDGDADRLAVIDEKGNFIDPQVLLCIFASEFSEGKVVASIDSTIVLNKILGDDRVEITKTGDVFVSARLKEINGVFGGEPSGTFIFPQHSYCPDGIYAGVKFLAEADEPVSKIASRVPVLKIKKGSLRYPKERRNAIEPEVIAALTKLGGRSNTLDGIKLQFEDASVLVRFSGTEPKIRITVECEDADKCEKIYGMIASLVERCIS